ncbi:hypothetical protein ACFQ4C_21400 [Larkinella insperata]|uniref:Uncharacterized protein n=1 Tax=Larkinella insperata TaxID=332158 RepID=A0ABW3QL07_9BACT
MTLYFFLRDSDSPCVCCAELEIQLDVLNSFLAIGHVLESAYLLDDNGTRLDLPIGAFDGLPVTNSIRNLTLEFQHLLEV